MNKYIFPGKRYFISHIDSRVCTEIVDILSKEKTEKKHLVIGRESNKSVKNRHSFIERVIGDDQIELMGQLIVDSDVIIYDLMDCDLAEAEWVVKTLQMRELKEEKTLIMISNVMVWQGSQRKQKNEKIEGGDEPEEEEDLQEDPLSEEG